MNTLNADIEKFVEGRALEMRRPDIICGFADVSTIAPVQIDGETAKSAISIASAFNPAVISGLSEGPTREYLDESVSNLMFLMNLSSELSDYLEGLGYKAAPLDSLEKELEPYLCSPEKKAEDDLGNADDEVCFTWYPHHMLHRLLATHAGLGWIGKNGLVVTKRFGCAVMLGTVLTTAPLECATEVFLSRCGRCRECATICPADAIGVVNRELPGSTKCFIDTDLCEEECRRSCFRNFGIEADVCGLCIYACPYTASYLQRRGL